MEAEILIDIRDSEKKAGEILENARREAESIVQEAAGNSSKLMAAKEEEARKLQEKKIMEFRGKAKLIREEKLSDGKAAVKQLKAKAEKNIPKAVGIVMQKFEEMI